MEVQQINVIESLGICLTSECRSLQTFQNLQPYHRKTLANSVIAASAISNNLPIAAVVESFQQCYDLTTIIGP